MRKQILYLPIEIAIEAVQALSYGRINTRLTGSNETDGTLVLEAEYDPQCRPSKAVMENVGWMITEFDHYRNGKNELETEEDD
jgi:hypothetical protein